MKEEKIYPLISIVMPIYNSAKFLRKSIPSVMAQEYPNLEIVLLNNGSTDESATIIEEYAKQDNRIKNYTIEHVGTPKESRDNAVYRAKGDWIIAVDSDDSIEPGYVEKLWKRHEETDADCVCAIMVFDDNKTEDNRTIPSMNFDKEQVLSGTDAMLKTLFDWEIGLNGALWKRDLLDITNIIVNPNKSYYSDECDSRILLSSCKRVTFANANYFYYINSESTGKKMSVVSILYGLKTMVGLYQFFNEKFGDYSILTQGCILNLHRNFRYALNKLIRNRSLAKRQISKHDRAHIQEAYNIISQWRNNIGAYRWEKDMILHKIYKAII